MLEEQAFDSGRHDSDGFTCAVPVLDDWLRRFATPQRRNGISTVFVLVDSAATGCHPGLVLPWRRGARHCRLERSGPEEAAALPGTVFSPGTQ